MPNVVATLERGEVGGRLHDDAEHEKQDAERATPEVADRARVDLKRPPEWQMSWTRSTSVATNRATAGVAARYRALHEPVEGLSRSASSTSSRRRS